MEIILQTTGTQKGRISVARTIASMELGDIWKTSTAEIDLDYTRVAASKVARLTGKQFNVCYVQSEQTITVTRLK
jgi:hypothetical protein